MEDTTSAVSETASPSGDGIFASPSGTAISAHRASTRPTTGADTFEGRPLDPPPGYDRIPRQLSTGRAFNADPSKRCREIYDDLVHYAEMSEPMCSLEVTIHKCIDLYMEWIFPISPLACEAHIRTGVATILRVAQNCTETLDPNLSGIGEDTSASTNFSLLEMRIFSSLTALCSITCCVVPGNVWPAGNSLAWPLLQASRDILACYQDIDIQTPDSSSIIVRYYQANAFHALGKTRTSWHVMGEALRLAQEMRLFDEAAYQGVDIVEGQILRNVFWHMHSGDKSAAILNNVPITLHQILLGSTITTDFYGQQNTQLIDAQRHSDAPNFEHQLYEGFHICQRMWSTASNVLVDIQVLIHVHSRFNLDVPNSGLTKAAITDSYMSFSRVIDDLPAWLRDPMSVKSSDERSERSQRRAFWTQRANLLVTFHCLRLILLQKCAEHGLLSLLGLSEDETMLAFRKTEIASDLLNVAMGVPFEALQANGEPCVSSHIATHFVVPELFSI